MRQCSNTPCPAPARLIHPTPPSRWRIPSLCSGLKGGACMVPLCFIIPVALWSSYNKGYKASKLRLAFNYALIAVLSAIALVATVGSSALGSLLLPATVATGCLRLLLACVRAIRVWL